MNAKSNIVTAWLVGLLVLGVLATATLSFAYVYYLRKLRTVQREAAVDNRDLIMFQQLAAEAVAYSKQNPKMDKILQEVLINKVQPAPDQAPAPSGAK